MYLAQFTEVCLRLPGCSNHHIFSLTLRLTKVQERQVPPTVRVEKGVQVLVFSDQRNDIGTPSLNRMKRAPQKRGRCQASLAQVAQRSFMKDIASSRRSFPALRDHFGYPKFSGPRTKVTCNAEALNTAAETLSIKCLLARPLYYVLHRPCTCHSKSV